MWTCLRCGEKVEDQFDSCWKCTTPRGVAPATAATGDEPQPPVISRKNWSMAYKYFRGTLATWDQLFGEAAAFATEIGPEWVVGISHSCDEGDGVVTVWYWKENSAE